MGHVFCCFPLDVTVLVACGPVVTIIDVVVYYKLEFLLKLPPKGNTNTHTRTHIKFL